MFVHVVCASSEADRSTHLWLEASLDCTD